MGCHLHLQAMLFDLATAVGKKSKCLVFLGEEFN